MAVIALVVLLTRPAKAQFPYVESFRNSTASGIVFGGTPEAILTAAPGTGTGGASIDPAGSGYLRLTNNTKNQKGFIYSTASFPSSKGLSVEFEYYIYGGTGADGICLFLYDASASPFVIGGFGGSLGYAQITTTTPVSPGVSKGYLGIGLDEFGNFSNPTEGRQGGSGMQPGSVTLRGKGDGAALTTGNYQFLTSKKPTDLTFALTEGGTTRKPDVSSTGYRKVFIDLVPNVNGGFNISVSITKGGSTLQTTTVIDNYYYPDLAPQNLSYGLSSSTGANTNFHEIRNVFIDVTSKSVLVEPLANPDNLTLCSGKVAIVDVTANDTTTNKGGSINKVSIDLDPSTVGIQTTNTIANQGTFSLNSNGTVSFTPISSFIGTVTGYYTVKDNFGMSSNPGIITLTYVATPVQPDAGKDSLINIITGAGNYILQGSAPGTNTGTWTQISGPEGAIILSPKVYNSLVNKLTGGIYVFRWTILSPGGCQLSDDMTLTVNRRPVAVDDTTTIALNTAIRIPVLANDTDEDGNNTLNKSSISIKTNPSHGALIVDPVTGLVFYTPNNAYSGYDIFFYTVKDNYGLESNIATVTIAVNIKPEGSNDNAFTYSNIPVLIRVLDNDRGRTGATVFKLSNPLHGTVALETDGTFTYTPVSGFSGKDSFTYMIRNLQNLESDPITVFINVNPLGSADAVTTASDTPVTIRVKDNDLSQTGTTVQQETNPLHGSIAVGETGIITYTPVAGYTGTDVFTYTLVTSDGLQSLPINVTVSITGLPPIAPAINVNVPLNGSTTINIPLPAGSFIKITTPPTHGTYTINPVTGEIIYTPNPGYSGPDEFEYTVTDGAGNESTPGKVTIAVNVPAKIGLAKALTSISKNTDGSYNIKFTFTIVNYGDYRIERLSLTDNLLTALAGNQFNVSGIAASGSLLINSSFNGNTDQELLLNTSSIQPLYKETVVVDLVVLVTTDETTFLNRALVKGLSVLDGAATTDESTNGLSPDSQISGDPTPSDPTPFTLEKETVFIPGGFSPNNDGINDNLIIQNALGKKVDIEIFNRWGNRVFRSKEYQNTWNGKCTEGIHMGEDVPVGTYYYIVVLDNKEKKAGYLTINR
ncbi:hypothetical protein ADIARSV_1862 [Arcticibacter svalbardensis MN12-7]|uniref:Tandem-95 repeat protein n=2 Tax=Arcticibacter TaxID=1288026 RepID=R9GTE5_9SPHI|nr:hypothetical protein ADIARSV_1862 [Arcticibacter svalbardensis MN12-7]